MKVSRDIKSEEIVPDECHELTIAIAILRRAVVSPLDPTRETQIQHPWRTMRVPQVPRWVECIEGALYVPGLLGEVHPELTRPHLPVRYADLPVN
ncbi:hypothetical protein FF011L_34420 [Roseimaritima multifibrata]|uniref:Uncharacterized protein n=1 Tax=Roseimaritima multifibrata TaxID=1930274 RepID=A0A517MIF7_9BACT|nr:hypothetical protein FF011L_34420 [Roseimaritima multifibrata]